MESHIIKHFHRYLSAALFVLCLMFSAFFTSETYKPQLSINLLLMGWLGLLGSYFSWLANSVYLLALISKKSRTTIILSLLALVLSLSFLTHEKLVISEAPTYEKIVAYGPGYFLWVLAFFTILFGEALKNYQKSNCYKLILISATNIFLTMLYGIYYFEGENSIHHIFSERNKHFVDLCSKVYEKQYKPVINIKGVFIDHVPGYYFNDISGQKHGGYGGDLISYAGGGYYDFEERKPYSEKETKLPYVRIYDNEPNKRIPTEKLESNYSVTSIDLSSNLPKSLGIRSYKILIKSLDMGEVYAETSFVSIKNELKVCAPTTEGETYSIRGFVFNTLGLRESKS